MMHSPNSTDHGEPDFYLRIINDSAYWLGLAAAGFALSVVTIAGNFTLLATTWKDPHKSLRTPPCLLIANLSFADFLVGLCVVPFVVVRDVFRSCQQIVPVLPLKVGQIIGSYILCTTLFVSSATIVAMSITCFVAINNPMQYKIKITKKRVYRIMAGIWTTAILICFLPATKIPENTYLLVYIHTHISLPALLLMVIYAKGFRALARLRREVLPQTSATDVNNSNNRRIYERERNMAVTVTIILTMFYITYIPQFITIHLANFCSSCEIREDSLTFHKVDVIFSRLIFLNTAVNPFVYAWRMPKYRQALVSCCKALKNKLKFGSREGA